MNIILLLLSQYSMSIIYIEIILYIVLFRFLNNNIMLYIILYRFLNNNINNNIYIIY